MELVRKVQILQERPQRYLWIHWLNHNQEPRGCRFPLGKARKRTANSMPKMVAKGTGFEVRQDYGAKQNTKLFLFDYYNDLTPEGLEKAAVAFVKAEVGTLVKWWVDIDD